MDQQAHRMRPDPAVRSVYPAEPAAARPPRDVAPITTGADARQFRVALLDLTDRLVDDLDWVPAGRVIAAVATSRTELVRLGYRGDVLLAATEVSVRTRLDFPSPRD